MNVIEGRLDAVGYLGDLPVVDCDCAKRTIRYSLRRLDDE